MFFIVDGGNLFSGAAARGIVEDEELAVREDDVEAAEGGVTAGLAVEEARHLYQISKRQDTVRERGSLR